jgi:hypothetical protein
MHGLVRLPWECDSKGYSIEERSRVSSAALKAFRGTILEGLDGLLDEDDGLKFCVVPKGGAPKRRVFEGLKDNVFVQLANTPCTHDGVKNFVDEYGLPFRNMARPELYYIYKAVRDLASAVEHVRAGCWADFERSLGESKIAEAQVRFGKLPGDSAPRLFLQPKSLISFCCLELMQASGGVEIQQCANPKCAAFLPIEMERRRGTKRIYCKDSCKVAGFRLRGREKKRR